MGGAGEPGAVLESRHPMEKPGIRGQFLQFPENPDWGQGANLDRFSSFPWRFEKAARLKERLERMNREVVPRESVNDLSLALGELFPPLLQLFRGQTYPIGNFPNNP